ncbi:sphingolipid 8-(E)-desaturase [Malassezia obtusa]|uniref:Delta 8-(E)-sphingolipid desaturase n=1 Tax=Malassezia obtusa TaxID=76774 RepID=A0AAF0E0J1_9BASI|nr:sphingolipid 8-(E)-desaturase [Malassezia obtusa]
MALPKKVLTRAQIAERIAHSEVLVLHRRLVYKLDNWVHQHPGGDLAILHFVGRDAKDEIEVYHAPETIATLMRRFAIAQLAEEDATDVARGRVYRPLMPPIALGYRNGQLDHPDAQLAAWHASGVGKEQRARIAAFPLPVELLEPPESPLPLLREARISAAFERMHQQIRDAGLYDLQPRHYLRESVRYTSLGVLAYITFRAAQRTDGWGASLLYTASALFLGLLWHQLTFVAHDAGHTGITHNYALDRFIGVTVASYLGGLSLVWWCDNHDVHHLVTNHPEHDPDIQHMPIFAISPRFVTEPKEHGVVADQPAQPAKPSEPAGLWSSYYRRVLYFDAAARVLLRVQHKLYYIIMSLARFNLYALSYGFLLLRARRDRWFWYEMTGLVAFWAWYGGLVLRALPSWGMVVVYLLVSHIAASPVHVQIVLSHFAQDTSDLGPQECFASRQIRTTMDVQCPSYLDFVHGGLHMQVTHHLFPRLPRHNLRETRDRFVRPFCDALGLVYEERKFGPGNGKVLARLKEVADQVHFLFCVADAQARGELHS